MTVPLSDYETLSVDFPTPGAEVPSLELIRATAKVLLFSGGQSIVIADLKPEECEQLSIELRAKTGVIPYGLWAALTDKARCKLAVTTRTKARQLLAGKRTPT